MKKLSLILFTTTLLFNSTLLFSQGIETQNRDDAGAFGANVKSGFIQTTNPINFPAGATSWWHLLDVRHSNTFNNYAMQFSGSFYDQNLYFRKTENVATKAWNKILMENAEGKVSIGGNADWERLTLNGEHHSTTFLMHADNTNNPHAYLSLWASEPSATYNGVGIGNNVRNYFNNQAFTRINTSAGGSYIRLLDQQINFSIISNTGVTKTPFVIRNDGTSAFEGPILSSVAGSEGGSLALVNPTKTGAQHSAWIMYNMTGGYGNSLQFWNYSADGTNYGSRLKISDDGNMALYGKFEAKEVKVTTTPTADFVFEENYSLPKLEDVERYIKEKKHLPEIASAKEMEKEGVNVGEFQIKLLQKIEELTLYSIEQNKQLKEQAEKIKKLEELLSPKN